ncbi:MAG: cyclic nucleotide-binding domain-containing protein, partial [Lentisphaerae bacterium]|nr:cyclic nucleotide-binding domain-containing protein [Lentisphaerota bacterium]
MQTIPITGEMTDAVVKELRQSALFRDLAEKDLKEITKSAVMLQYDDGETVVEEGGVSDSFFVIASGEAVIKRTHETSRELIEIARVKPFDTIGELGLLLGQPRTATVTAGPDTLLLKFNQTFFQDMFRKFPDFALVACKVMAKRVQQSVHTVAPAAADAGAPA